MSKGTVKRPLASNGEDSMLKMKELIESTGVAKSTIIHYVNEGLLPKPLKTSANMAYYEHSCIERVIFIKKLQSKHRLGLGQIKVILKERDKNREVTSLIELWDVVFDQNSSKDLDKTSFYKATGLSSEELDELVTRGLIIPKKDGCFDSEDVNIGKVFRQAIDLGLKPEHAMFYRRYAKKIVENEMAIRKEMIKDQSQDEVIASTLDLTRIARSLRAYIIDREFQIMAFKQDL